jgi:hypothetical protein
MVAHPLSDETLAAHAQAAARGAVYTPELLARWVARQFTAALPAGPVTVADLACGRGALLAAVRRARPGVRLVGVDVDAGDLRIAAAELPAAHLVQGDSLMLRESSEFGPFDGIILNPPWGILLPHDQQVLRALGYTLAEGQFDSANLFVELSLSLLPEGGVSAFILPDSIFFPEHVRLRRLLLRETELLLVARLGEGFFRGVFRGTAVVVTRKATPTPHHRVECLRLGAGERRAILDGELDLDAFADSRLHAVPQVRFAHDTTFEIDVREEYAAFVSRMRARGGHWSQWFNSGRGVELSKLGRVVRCRSCRHAWPVPRTPRLLVCPGCGAAKPSADLPVEVLVRPLDEAEPGWAPLIAGVDVERYRCVPTHAIRVGVPGINYKSEQARSGERILVRKTGVGLRAAVTDESAYSTQVVYHYVPNSGAPRFLASYVQGVLASRVMLAYHLLVTGENEWRSHPYVTQQVISSLPVPDPVNEPTHRATAEAIADAARAYTAVPTVERDLAIEALVVDLFGLDAADVAIAAEVLDEAQNLQGIRELRFRPGAVA